MTFAHHDRAAQFFAMRPFNPTPLPAGYPGQNWQPAGFATNFVTKDIDPAHSFGYFWEANRSFVCPSRTNGADFLGEQFTNGLYGYALSQGGTGMISVNNNPDPDPAINGVALDLNTGATPGSVAGIRRSIGSLPTNYGVMLLPRLIYVGTDPANALQVWIQDASGRTLMIRLMDNAVDIAFTDGWRRAISHGGNFFWELWIENHDNGDGTNTITPYAGTQLSPPPSGNLTGVLFTNQMANNSVLISQGSSGTANWRESQIKQLNIGSTQLPDHMNACLLPYVVQASPTAGHLWLAVEDTALSLQPNVNFTASITKALPAWQPVTLTELTPSYFQGEVDPTKPVRIFTGTATFPAGTGTELRWSVNSTSGAFPVLQAAAIFCD